jgi:hypothetical protein
MHGDLIEKYEAEIPVERLTWEQNSQTPLSFTISI